MRYFLDFGVWDSVFVSLLVLVLFKQLRAVGKRCSRFTGRGATMLMLMQTLS